MPVRHKASLLPAPRRHFDDPASAILAFVGCSYLATFSQASALFYVGPGSMFVVTPWAETPPWAWPEEAIVQKASEHSRPSTKGVFQMIEPMDAEPDESEEDPMVRVFLEWIERVEERGGKLPAGLKGNVDEFIDQGGWFQTGWCHACHEPVCHQDFLDAETTVSPGYGHGDAGEFLLCQTCEAGEPGHQAYHLDTTSKNTNGIGSTCPTSCPGENGVTPTTPSGGSPENGT